jgi:hypothetical protein
MRVAITDKEALRALSWPAVTAYLDAAGWHQVEDIPGTSVAYQHTDKDGRLWEILVLLRDDLADYVSRMGDAVSTLARVEDRSELDIYDDLAAQDASASSHEPGNQGTKGYAQREPFRRAIATLTADTSIELSPGYGESLTSLKLNLAQAAREVGRTITYGETSDGTLVAWLDSGDNEPETRPSRNRTSDRRSS